MERKRKRKLGLSVLLILVLVISSILAAIYYVRRPGYLFKEVVLKPIPKSVKNIRATSKRSVVLNTGHTYVLGFDIGKEDLSLILGSEPFTEIEDVSYNDDSGTFAFGTASRGMTITLYERNEGERAPEWFELNTWDNFRVYLVEDAGLGWYRMRLLLYREDLGRAYFIEHKMNGTRQDGRDYMVLKKD